MLLFSQFFFDKSGIYIKTVLQSRPSLYIIMVRRRKAARKPRVAVITPDNDMITAARAARIIWMCQRIKRRGNIFP